MALMASDSQASKNLDVGLNISVRIAIGPTANAKVRMTLERSVTKAPKSKKMTVPSENITDAITRSSRNIPASFQSCLRRSLAWLFAASKAPNTVVGAA